MVMVLAVIYLLLTRRHSHWGDSVGTMDAIQTQDIGATSTLRSLWGGMHERCLRLDVESYTIKVPQKSSSKMSSC